MTGRQIDRFLKILANELGRPARAYLTGAAAAALWGRVRPSVDIDLGLELRSRPAARAGARLPRAASSGGGWEIIQAAIDRTTRLTGIPTSVAEDIDRWGMITLLDYRRTSRLYRRFGQLEVRLLDPVTWAIGKLTRALDPDLRDVVEVFRRQAVSWRRAARTWGLALRASPASTAQFQFRQHVMGFFRAHGAIVWGKTYEAGAAVRAFEKAADITFPDKTTG